MLRETLLILALVAATMASSRDTLVSFRDIFAANCLRHNESIDDEDIKNFILFPTEGLIATEEMKSIEEVDQAYNATKPSDCLKAGHTLPFTHVDPLAPLLHHVGANGPVSLFFLPYMCNEMVPTMPLGGAFNEESELAVAWAHAIKKNPTKVKVWDNHKFKYEQLSLDKLVKASSIDLPNGTTTINTVWFNAHEGSLETLRDYQIVVPSIVERITKFLDLIGDRVTDFVLVGYSRGAADAMEIMATRDRYPWGKRLRGLISLDGVIYGTTVADCALGRIAGTPPICKSLIEMTEAVKSLNERLVPKITRFVQNTEHLVAVLAKFDEAALSMPWPEEMKHTVPVFPDIIQSWNDIVRPMIFDMFDVWHPVLDYDNNIRRLQLLITGLLESMEFMSTQNRTEWHQTRTLPPDGLYMSITSSMEDRADTFRKLYPDEYLMRQAYYMIAEATGMELIDGAIPTDREKFLSNVHMALNPKQLPYENQHWLGLFNSEHLGIALDHAIPAPNDWTDPFPRRALLDSLATWIAIHS